MLHRFFYDNQMYDLDFEATYSQDQDILLPDGRVLVVGNWKPVHRDTYSDKIAFYRPAALRERTISQQSWNQKERATSHLAHAQPVRFAPMDMVFQPITYREASDIEVEQLLIETFGRPDYCIAEGWRPGSYHPYVLDQSLLSIYQEMFRESVAAYLQDEVKHPPELRWLLCECVLLNVLQEGAYLIYRS